MPLVLPPDHPSAALGAGPESDGGRALRVGIINIMPRLEAYEPSLLRPLSRSRWRVEPVFVRLESHGYTSSDHEHLDWFYQSFDCLFAERCFDGLILTGAPVEEMPFEEVRYFPELRQILALARTQVASTLGICWGALALGQLVGVDKKLFRKKLFGVYRDRLLVNDHPLLRAEGGAFPCAHSRHSGVSDPEMEQAQTEGRVRLLSHGEQTGYSVFETPDHRYLMHLGHPEYEADRLLFEWERDRALNRPDVDPPYDFDPSSPRTTWADHRQGLIDRWLDFIASAAPR